jgi:hypothetical protein
VHRKRRYCDEACRQRAHRARQAEQAEAERKGSLQSDLEQAARLEKLEEEKQALLRECGRQVAEARQQEAQIEKLMAENARLRRRLDLETNYRGYQAAQFQALATQAAPIHARQFCAALCG